MFENTRMRRRENFGMERAEIHRRLDKTVEDMKLSALLGRNIFELSGGEKQQIACGSVYTAGPDVYVLDEPSSNLDKKAITRLHETLRRIKDEGGTILVSEHRLYYLLDLADRFLYLNDGIITRSFTPGELCGLPDSELASLGLRCTDLHTLEKSPLIGEIPHGAKPALEAIDLGCSRGNHQILDIDRMSIPEHSIVAMIGDNGCGKSTLTESLCGVIPANGSVAFRGTYLTDRERAGRSYLVMQEPCRYWTTSVSWNSWTGIPPLCPAERRSAFPLPAAFSRTRRSSSLMRPRPVWTPTMKYTFSRP